jgi:hypothetical protein
MSDGVYRSSFDNRLELRAVRRGPMQRPCIHWNAQGVLNHGQIELADGRNSVLALRPIDAWQDYKVASMSRFVEPVAQKAIRLKLETR